jgi:GT2 family glycosyltransferase
MSDQVSIIIPVYWVDQTLIDMTEVCLRGLAELNLDVIVVDDGSPLKHVPSVGTVYSRPTNGGYAAAVNTGLEHSEGQYIIVCNNDIEFIQPDWLDRLLYPVANGWDIASIRTTDCDGWLTEDKITEGDKFGSIWVMKRSVYEAIGGLDETFGKGYFEDLDFKKRAEAAGFRVAKNHAGIVDHHGKATFSRVDPDDEAYYRAMARFKEKYGQVE